MRVRSEREPSLGSSKERSYSASANGQEQTLAYQKHRPADGTLSADIDLTRTIGPASNTVIYWAAGVPVRTSMRNSSINAAVRPGASSIVMWPTLSNITRREFGIISSKVTAL